jgi:diguanylate cyclase (GGDEF)-like protein/PAS domain S-box-containing protein
MRLSRAIFLFFTLCILALDATFVLVNQRALDAELDNQIAGEARQLRAAFSTIVDQTFSNLLTVATFVANDRQTQLLFQEGVRAVRAEGGGAGGPRAAAARNALYDLLADNWLEVQRRFSTRQLHFHYGPGSNSFLRVHRPERFGDNMDAVRYTIVDTIEEGEPRYGFETGRVYSGLRGVVPVFAPGPQGEEQVLVGALEAGTAFDTVLRILKQNYGVEAGVLLSRAHVESNMWPEAIARHFSVSMPSCDCLVEASTSDALPGLVNSLGLAGLRLADIDGRIVDHEGMPVLVATQALRDYRATRDPALPAAGRVVFWSDASAMLSGVQAAKRFNLLFAALGFVLLETLLFFGLRFGMRRLEREIDARVEDVRRSEHRLQRAQDIAGLAHWEWDAAGNRVLLSEQSCRMLGIDTPGEALSLEAVLERVHPADRNEVESVMRAAARPGGSMQLDHRIIAPDGGERTVQHFAEAEVLEHGALQLSSTLLDITERHRNQQALHQAATHDSLTGALNRSGFRERAVAAQAWAVRHAAPVAVMVLDADHFKRVNDRFGHEAGDRVLVSIVRRVNELLRPYDVLGRMGGEEFAVFMGGVTRDRVEAIAERLRQAIGELPVSLASGEKIRVTVSVGVVFAASADIPLDALLDTADQAMYEAKQGGRDRVAVCEGEPRAPR